MESQTPAGWYPDPWGAAPMRYWDGVAWTGNTAGQPSDAALQPTGKFSEDNSARAEKYGRIGFTLWAVQSAAIPLLLGTIGLVLGFVGDALRESSATTSGEPSSGLSAAFFAIWLTAMLGGLLLSALTYTSLGYMMAWTYRSSENARDLGIKTRFSSTLACFGWIIPYANYVMPYMAAKSLVPNNEGDSQFLRWWLIHLLVPTGAVVLCFSFMFLGFFLGPIGGAIALLFSLAIGAFAGIVVYRTGIAIERLVAARHREIAAGLAAQQPV